MRGFVAWIILGAACVGSISAAQAVGPSYDCSKASTPGQQLICADAELSREDLVYAQAYYALRHQTGDAGWRSLKQSAIAYEIQALQSCGVPLSGRLLPYPYGAMARCLEQAYERQRQTWIAELNGPAAEEALRPVEEHIALQATLQKLGYLPADESLDGVYGTQTRDAIERWQRANSRLETGFIGNGDAAMMFAEQTQKVKPKIAAVPTAPSQTANISTPPPQTWSNSNTAEQAPPAATQQSSATSVNNDDNASSGSAATAVGGVSLILILVIIGLVSLYFLPAIIGSRRQISSSGALFFVNFFFGWTVLGWLFCMLWAATAATRGQDAFYNSRATPPGPAGSNPMADPVFREAYARERARLDHEAGV